MKRREVFFIKTGELMVLARRMLVVALFLLSFILILLDKMDSSAANTANRVALETAGPIMQAVEYPSRIIHRIYTYFYDVSHIYTENLILRAENKQMMILQNKVRTLEVENQLLGRLLNYVPPEDASFITAKIIAESGDNFTQMLLLYIGNEGVRKGQIVLGDESVVGRIDEVGGHFARAILVTDINSKIPVVVERTRARAILSGDNTMMPKLVFLRSAADVQEGDVIVTSGVGGMFPAGLPIGFVNSVKNGEITVETMADISRIEYVRIVDYGIAEQADENIVSEFMESEQ